MRATSVRLGCVWLPMLYWLVWALSLLGMRLWWGLCALHFPRMPGESYRRRLWFLLLCSCDVVRATVISLMTTVDSSLTGESCRKRNYKLLLQKNKYTLPQYHIMLQSNLWQGDTEFWDSVTVEFAATWYWFVRQRYSRICSNVVLIFEAAFQLNLRHRGTNFSGNMLPPVRQLRFASIIKTFTGDYRR